MLSTSFFLSSLFFALLIISCERYDRSDEPEFKTPFDATDDGKYASFKATLEEVRAKIVTTLKVIEEEKSDGLDLTTLCHLARVLPKNQQAIECDKYIKEVATEILSLNLRDKPVPFIIMGKEQPLKTPNKEGKLVPTVAITEKGPEGPILFDYHAIKNWTTMKLFRLIFHELSHKSLYQGKYLGDHDPIGAFDEETHLINTGGTTLALFAGERKIIGTKYPRKFDKYACEFKLDSRPGIFKISARDFRRPSHAFDKHYAYTSGFGFADFGEAPEYEGPEGTFRLRLAVNETRPCEEKINPDRFTVLELVKLSEDAIGGEVVKRMRWPGININCDDSESPNLFINLKYEGLSFSCWYQGADTVVRSKSDKNLDDLLVDAAASSQHK